ncbi:unnamed protein product [Ilex paraguariensis]|uniref:RIN4 pathogenic type III effector avirulence factor Avr cleavage site domain-containing protein n=2 Tax=Ilex paraguariensis TaxID=185542 RepID=A0ABC8U3V6_9AQUA
MDSALYAYLMVVCVCCACVDKLGPFFLHQHPQVPKFGNWESEENIPYTAYFDNARKGRKGGNMNPNDPQDNADRFSDHSHQEAELKGQKGPGAIRSKHKRHTSREDGELRGLSGSPLHPDTVPQNAAIDSSRQQYGGARSGSSTSESEAPKGPDALRPKDERRLSRDEGDLRRPTDSPVRHDTVGRRANVDSPHHCHGGTTAGDTPRRVTRQGGGSDRSIEHSPLHPHHQGRVGGKGIGVSSPSWERKGSSDGSHGLAPSTPGRSRLRSVTRGDETPDRSPAVPKFGDWNESDPASAEGFTHIFNRVREERQVGAGTKVPIMPTETSYSNGQKRYETDNSKGCCCFPWGRK